MYMAGCELKEAYPVVPLAQGHALSIGMTTVRDRACFGLYADGKGLADIGWGCGCHGAVNRRAGGGEPAMSGVLLTGATGFVGMEMLCRYLERDKRTSTCWFAPTIRQRPRRGWATTSRASAATGAPTATAGRR